MLSDVLASHFELSSETAPLARANAHRGGAARRGQDAKDDTDHDRAGHGATLGNETCSGASARPSVVADSDALCAGNRTASMIVDYEAADAIGNGVQSARVICHSQEIPTSPGASGSSGTSPISRNLQLAWDPGARDVGFVMVDLDSCDLRPLKGRVGQ